jgi:hypothetical protein
MELYLESGLSLEELGKKVIQIALPAYAGEVRDDSNMGGGAYYELTYNKNRIILIRHDSDHAQYFVERMKDFPYFFCISSGPSEILEDMLDSLTAAGFTCELADYGYWMEAEQDSGWRIKQ